MQNYRSKRKAQAIRFFSYGVMTLATVVISIFCIFLILGYRFDTSTGVVSQGGLFQFRSFPNNSVITLDDKKLNFRTPGKLNVAVGTHKILMQLDGYQEWRKTVSIKAGELRWLNYIRFVPTSITTTTAQSFPLVSDASQSPDRRWFAILGDPTVASVNVVDLRSPEETIMSSITLPASSYTNIEGQTHNFTIDKWDFGSRFFLVQHRIGDVVEFIRLDRTNPSSAVNLTRQFNLPFSSMYFSGTSGNVFYSLSGTDLRQINLGSGTVSVPLVTDVNSFELYKSDDIAYIATREEKHVVGVYIDDKETVVRSYPIGQPLQIDLSSYFENDYLAIGSGKTTEIIKDPLENADTAGRVFAILQTPFDTAWLQFANSGRFVVAGNGSKYSTYDLETDEKFQASFNGIATDPSRPMQWLDDYYLLSNNDTMLTISEFDGQNQHQIAPAVPGLAVTLSENGEYLFSISRTEDGRFILQSSKMTVN